MTQKINNKAKRVTLSITGNIATDQRVHKVAVSLLKIGLEPLLIGRNFQKNNQLKERAYKFRQLDTFFIKGFLFYAEYNIRLFFILLFWKSEILLSNDLDTLLANFLCYRIKKLAGKKVRLVYDSHELFTEVPELNNRKFVKGIWKKIESSILPCLKNTYTVCGSIANHYKQEYGISMLVIKNFPSCSFTETEKSVSFPFLPVDKKIILYQGALNIGRGIEHIIPLMKFIDNAVFVIIGRGDMENELKLLVAEEGLEDKILFTGNLDLEQLNALTPRADVGLVLQEDISLSYHYVLPNRLFDFIKASIPVLASNLPEIEKIVESEKIGLIVNSFEPDILLKNLNLLLNDNQSIQIFKGNINKCKENYCWEAQEEVLFELFQNLKA